MVALPSVSFDSQTLKRWNVDEYHRMAESGVLAECDRTELLAGQVILMIAKGTPHVTALRLLATALDKELANQPFFVSTQDPIQLDSYSEPEPDLAIVKGNFLDYAAHHPTPKDICLIVEVADSTLKQDCEVKDKLYAQAGITDYWVLDLPHRQLHVFRSPTVTGYTSHLILTQNQKISPVAFPDSILLLKNLLPPAV
ncbi:Uma2 family endonuclease [Leptolyngbya cf. ectocarpi LEGE 11479]|uniref:Uma2 family endonuclease n=1 Tax=Leptolyngbya cf. ectocarpi LEGE 11479 TaxID=1828722 RepID=A0A929FAC3_LEPEC|nr:Uma2 family endonuclease [Leptolyngbya ectocarpi]MBE9070325.1 Uma2 family endonuclease [Leptolyngbya cf. ectocarpi LEGE 11479]